MPFLTIGKKKFKLKPITAKAPKEPYLTIGRKKFKYRKTLY